MPVLLLELNRFLAKQRTPRSHPTLPHDITPYFPGSWTYTCWMLDRATWPTHGIVTLRRQCPPPANPEGRGQNTHFLILSLLNQGSSSCNLMRHRQAGSGFWVKVKLLEEAEVTTTAIILTDATLLTNIIS